MDASNAGSQSYQALEESIAVWGREEERVRAIVVVGSRARIAHGADQWSDLDLIVFATDPAPFAAQDRWLSAVGDAWLTVPNHTGHGDPEWLALFPGGLKADFVILPAGDGVTPVARLLETSPYHFVYALGLRVLLDKNDPHGTHALPTFARAQPAPPDGKEFANQRASFLLNATRAARFIARGDLWRAKMVCDHLLKQHLLMLLEWHAQAMGAPDAAIYYEGRYLEEWADPAALRDLPGTFAQFERADLARALLATLSLYRRLAQETAAAFGYALAETREREITAWIQTVLGVNPQS